jgi:hypothetical protein
VGGQIETERIQMRRNRIRRGHRLADDPFVDGVLGGGGFKCRLPFERMIENLSAICACSGMYSQISIPGTLVRIGLSGPRYSLGASGFMSYVSS